MGWQDDPVAEGWQHDPVVPAPSAGLDVAKQIAAGGAEGVEGMFTGPAHLSNLVGRGVQAAKDYLAPGSTDPVQLANEAKLRDLAKEARGGKNSFVEQYLPDPQTPEGQLARTSTSFAVQNLGAPGRLAVNAVGGAAAGAGSYAGEKLTDSPYGALAGALVGGLAGTRAAEGIANKVATPFQPSTKAILEGNQARYGDIQEQGNKMYVPQQWLDVTKQRAQQALDLEGPRQPRAPGVSAIVENLNKPTAFKDEMNPLLQARAPDINDLITRQKEAKAYFQPSAASPEKAAAAKVVPIIEDTIELRSPAIAQQLRTADKENAIGTAARKLGDKITEAEIAGQGKYSGLGTGDAIRSRVEQFLKSNDSKYLSDEARTELSNVAKGSMTEKSLRYVAKALGGGSGIGMLLGAAAGGGASYASGNPLFLAAAPLGFGARLASNALTKSAANSASALLRSESVLGGAAKIGMTPRLSNAQRRELAAVLAGRAVATPPE